MQNQESLKTVIDAVNSGKKYPALQLVNFNPEAAAVISKLFKSRDPNEIDMSKKESLYALNRSQIQAISDNVQNRINDNKNLLQLFPDIELAIQILTSSILSPKDMVSTEIIYKTEESILPAELTLKLLSVVQKHMTQYYKVENELNNMLRDMLFNTGSYVKLVMPESILDEVINKNTVLSTEALSELYVSPKDDTVRHLGFLGNSGEVKETRSALEHFTQMHNVSSYSSSIRADDDALNKALEKLVEVTDNYQLLKLPKLITAGTKAKAQSLLKRRRLATEAKLTNQDMHSLLYKDNTLRTDEFVIVPSRLSAKRKSIGRPLVVQLPSESVIPVHVPGDETQHIGYFVMIDIDGNPVTMASSSDCMGSLNNIQEKTNQSQGLSSLLIQRARKNLSNNDSMPTIDHITKVYSSILEKDLMERLRNGIYKSNVEISKNNEIYRIMLARALSNQYTRIVFIPEELVTYFAFAYFDNGIGKGYLENIKVLCSLRAILRFAKVMAMTKNAISVTHVNMTLDPNDPDPQKTIEIATHDIVKMRQQYFPLGTIAPMDLVDWIQRAGFEFSFEGHPGLPETRFDFESKQLQHNVPDSELDEELRKQTYMAFGLSPETVDNGYSADFATTVVANNILFSKRVIQLQQPFTEHLSDYCQKVVLNDALIIDELKEIMNENKGLVEKVLSDEDKTKFSSDQDFMIDLIESFVSLIRLDLPKPDITTIETQSSAYDNYVEALDKTIDAWINSESFPSDLVGDVSSNIDSVKAVLRNYFIRKWMAENGFMSELNDIVTTDENGKPSLDLFELNKAHMEGVVKSTLGFIQSLQGMKEAADTDIANMGVTPGESTDTTTDESTGLGGDEFGDMGFSDEGEDINPDETPIEDEQGDTNPDDEEPLVE